MDRILLIESDKTLREWVRLHLAAQGHQVTIAEDYRQVLDLARSERPDLIILDSEIREGNCFALAAALRSDVRTALTPLIFIVPADRRETFAQAVAIEPEGVVTRPFSWPVLRDLVQSRLGAGSAGATGLAERVSSASRSGPIGTAGLLVESRQSSVLFVSLRNLVSLARSIRARTLESLLQKFVADARDCIAAQGGWVVRTDATGLLALFEDGPNADRNHASRAVEAAMGTILVAKRVKQWAHATLSETFMPQISIGCGVNSGEVIIARLSLGGGGGPSVAGPAADIAIRLDGRSKGLGWSIAVSESSALLAGARFQLGRRATMTDADHCTIPIVEVTGFNPGAARPGELPMMAEAREAILANAVLAGLAGDADPDIADRTIVVSSQLPRPVEPTIGVPHRRIIRRLDQGPCVASYLAKHDLAGRDEVLKVIQVREVTDGFVAQYLDDYRRISELDQRNVLSVYEVGRSEDIAFVATEHLPGGTLEGAIRRRLPIGLSLNYLAQMSLALDALHSLDLCHGTLGAEHFLFRKERVVVLADFNATERCLAAGRPESPEIEDRDALLHAGRRADFRALGLIFSAMLRGDAPVRGAGRAVRDLSTSLRLPVELSPLKPCLEGLLGTGRNRPFERAEEVLVELMGLRDLFPFDVHASDADGSAALLP